MKHIATAPAFLLAALAGLTTRTFAAEMTGKEIFAHYCTYCHGSSDGPGTQQLRRTRGADKALLPQRTDLARDYIGCIVRHGLKSMPPFVPSDLTDARLQALVAYLTSPEPRQ